MTGTLLIDWDNGATIDLAELVAADQWAQQFGATATGGVTGLKLAVGADAFRREDDAEELTAVETQPATAAGADAASPVSGSDRHLDAHETGNGAAAAPVDSHCSGNTPAL